MELLILNIFRLVRSNTAENSLQGFTFKPEQLNEKLLLRDRGVLLD